MTIDRPVFASPETDRRFRCDGVAVITPGRSIVEAGRELVDRLARPGLDGLHISTIAPDLAYRAEVSKAVLEVAGPLVESLFVGYEAFHGNFLLLHPGACGLAIPHQDWTFVDETRWRSVLAWIPLVDVDDETGALLVATGSHAMSHNIRPSPIPHPAYGDPSRGQERSAMTSVPARAGDIVAFDHAVVHASTVNHTSALRPVLGVFLKPVEAQLVHYHLRDDGSMDVYQPPDGGWLLSLDPALGPRDLQAVGRTEPMVAGSASARPGQ